MDLNSIINNFNVKSTSEEEFKNVQRQGVLEAFQKKYGEKEEPGRQVKTTLDKDDFLKLMIEQMKNQDPTSPFKMEQMASEMAQFTTVEQLHNINDNVAKLIGKEKSTDKIALSHLIGRLVTIDGNDFFHEKGNAEKVMMDVKKNLQFLEFSLLDKDGNAVFYKKVENPPLGPIEYVWDGLNSNNFLQDSASLSWKVEGVDQQNNRISLLNDQTLEIQGISFQNGETMLLAGDKQYPRLIKMNNIKNILSAPAIKPEVPEVSTA